jgi:hypothetical protein
LGFHLSIIIAGSQEDRKRLKEKAKTKEFSPQRTLRSLRKD